MTKYQAEVVAMSSKTVLDQINAIMETTAWFIVGFSEIEITVGDESKNMMFDRKTGRKLSSHYFDTISKINRKK